MKRFHWPLQRLLEVASLRVAALRAELLALHQKLALLRADLAARQAAQQRALAEFAKQSFERRLASHQLFMRCSAAQEARLNRMREEIKAVVARQAQKMAELAKARSSEQTLERLREEAMARHMAELASLEQKQLDESSQVAFARNMASPAGPARSGSHST